MQSSFDNDVFLQFLKKWPSEAIRYLHKYYNDRLVHIAEQRTNDRQAAEDIVQQVFLDVWKKINPLTSQEGFLIIPYMVMLVKKKAITYYRQSISKSGTFRDSFDELISTLPSPEEDMVNADTRERIRDLVKKLPQRERDCIELRYFEGLSNDAVADRLGLSKKTIEKRLMTGIRLLREQKDYMW